MAIFETDSEPGFITSDNPCVWFDPKWHTRPPMYQAPALIYPTIEITMPASPKQSIVLNRAGLTGYIRVGENVVDDLNRRVRFNCEEYFVVNQKIMREKWFDRGVEPEDSWDKLHLQKNNFS